MTRRERLERKQERRLEWAEKAEARSVERFARAHDAVAGIPPGQPILVGHHSEGHHRRALHRHDANMAKGCEEHALARHHAGKADGLERQLRTSIYSDDPDAVEALEAKIAKLEAQGEALKAVNIAYRKAGKPDPAAGADTPGWRRFAELCPMSAEGLERLRVAWLHAPWEKQPVARYQLANLGGNLTRLRKRVEEVKTRQERSERAEASGGVALERVGDYARVTFAEKPERGVLDALHAADFRWGGGSWVGRFDQLPACVSPAGGEDR